MNATYDLPPATETHRMPPLKNQLPSWAIKSAQGITYWTGHRRALYNGYPIGESAFVAELCNLIFANLDKQSFFLKCEVMYRVLAKPHPRPVGIPDRARTDLVIYRKQVSPTSEPTPEYIVEVKRASSSASMILEDLKRLALIKAVLPECRALLYVIAEATRPTAYVSDKGVSITRKARSIKDSTGNKIGYYHIRLIKKAAHAITKIERAQYAVVLEVFV